MKAYVMLLASSPTKPDKLLIEQARKLDAAIASIEKLK